MGVVTYTLGNVLACLGGGIGGSYNRTNIKYIVLNLNLTLLTSSSSSNKAFFLGGTEGGMSKEEPEEGTGGSDLCCYRNIAIKTSFVKYIRVIKNMNTQSINIAYTVVAYACYIIYNYTCI